MTAVTAPQANMVVESVERADASAEGSDPSAAGDDEPPVRLPGLDQALAGAEAAEAAPTRIRPPTPMRAGGPSAGSRRSPSGCGHGTSRSCRPRNYPSWRR